jgi:L-arabonate dehydrase
MPSGKYLMEEFFYAGGLPVVIKRWARRGLLHKDALTVSGETIWERSRTSANNEDVILPADKALTQSGGIACSRATSRPTARC